jgi:hypothetical protein
MKHVITTLKTQLEVLEHHEAIHRKEGRTGAADAEAAWIAEIRDAVNHLESLVDPAVQQWLAGQETFLGKLRHAINCHSKENGSDTPGFILADYLEGCLNTYDKALQAREQWYGRQVPGVKAVDPEPTEPEEWWTAPVCLTEVTEGLPPTRMKVIGNTTYTSTVQVRKGVYRWSCNPDTTYLSLAEALRGEPFVDPEPTAPDPVFDRWLTFEEFVDIGRGQGVPCYGEQNMPWSFSVCGYPVTHENDDRYIVSVNGRMMNFYRGHEILFAKAGVSTRSVP